MRAPDDYQLGKCLRSSPLLEEYAAVRERDGHEVVLKRYRKDTGEPSRASLELDALRAVAGPGIPEALEIVRAEGPPILVLRPVPGVPLLAWMETRQPAPLEFLRVAMQIATLLGRVHDARLVHRSVSPGAISVEPDTAQVHLGEFGLARPLGTATPAGGRAEGQPERSVQALRYMSPEQTGRMGRGIDLRSDLYSLGATLYHALTGVPPFDDRDPLSLIHAHMAKLPVPALELRGDLPARLSRILAKLLQKNPEDRYQTAYALQRDLDECRAQLELHGTIDDALPLASGDVPYRPLFARRLYGRDAELMALRAAWSAAATGATAALFLRGPPGIGKSALVHELRAPIACHTGYLALGKFDLYRRDLPYGAFLQAFESLAQQILTESDASLTRWREELSAKLGAIARVLVDLVPDLRHVVRETEPVPPLGPSETLMRLSLAVQRLVDAVATPEHPLALFLDDVQWADAGSCELLRQLLLRTEPRALLVLVAYRDAEVDAAHPLRSLLAELGALGRPPLQLALQPLSELECAQMLADALGHSVEEMYTLAQCVTRKTGGVPWIIQQFLQHLYDAGLVVFDDGGWTWNESSIAALDIPESAVELMTAKIEKLAPELRGLLEFASCVGDEFDVELLSKLSRGEREPIKLALFALSDAGLIAPCAHGFRFVHDRIREAAQQLLSEEQRARIHFDTARVLLERTADKERDARVFEIVEHLNRGLVHISEELRVTTMELDLRAGTRALASGAAATACGYLDVARGLFREEDWRAHWAIGFQIHLQSAEGHFQTQEFDRALALLDALDRHPLTPIEYTQVAIKRVQVLALTQGPIECGPYVLAVLRRLGVRWPLHPSRLRGWLAMQWVRFKLRRRPDERLLGPAKSVDAARRATQLFINASGGVRSRIDAELSVLASCLSMRRALRLGYIGAPGFTLAGYTVFMHARIGDCALSRRLAGIALELSERVPDPVLTPRTQFMIHALLEPWLMRRRHALASMDRIAQVVSEVGDREFEYYARFLTLLFRGLGGDPIPQTAQLMGQLAGSVGRSGHWYPQPQAVHGVYNLLTEHVDDAEVERRLAASEAWMASNSGTEIFIRTAWLLVLCVRGRPDLGLAQSDVIASTLFRVTPYVHVADHTFLRGLCSAALAGTARAARRRQLRRDLKRSLHRLQTWAKGGPDFVPMQMLLEAETARLAANAQGARVLYERAAQAAAEQEFPHVAAFACERHARMLIGARRETEAAGVLKDAIAWYRKWGATPKVEALGQERQRLLAE